VDDKEMEESRQQPPEEEEEGIEGTEQGKQDNTLIKEASYFNNMKGSLKYKMLRWLRRVRRRMYNLNLRFVEICFVSSFYSFIPNWHKRNVSVFSSSTPSFYPLLINFLAFLKNTNAR
jgi:hypothetical protein